MGLFSGISKALKKVVKGVASVVAPAAPLLSLVPGIGPVAAGVATAAGALLTANQESKNAKEQQKAAQVAAEAAARPTVVTTTNTSESKVDYDDIRKRAIAAGFNPLTALLAGGNGTVSGTATTISPGVASYVPQLASTSTLQKILGAAGSGIAAYSDYNDRAADVAFKNLRNKQLAQEIANYGKASKSGAGFTVPTYNTTGPSPYGGTAQKLNPQLGGGGSPTWVIGGDGMGRAVADNPPEIETDAYNAARNGLFFPYVGQLIDKNTSPGYAASVAGALKTLSTGGLSAIHDWNFRPPNWWANFGAPGTGAKRQSGISKAAAATNR